MEQSIENIWKQGFMDEKLILPSKINDLYNKKSKLLIDKLRRTSKWDNLSLIPISLALLIYFSIQDKFIVGAYAMIVLLTLFLANRNHLKQLLLIDQNANCYKYLTSLRDGIKKTIKFYNRLMTIATPIVFSVGFWLYYADKKISQEILIVGISVLILIPIIGVISYRLSTKILYGAILKNLDATIEEMDELRG